LTFDLLTSKCIGVIYWPWPIFLPSRMTVTHKLCKILSRHVFCIKYHCDLDLWPSDLKMYRGHLLSMTNLPTKYHDCHSETFQDIEWKWFLYKMLLWPWHLTYWPQNVYGSSTDHNQSFYTVEWLSLINFSRYWADMVFALNATVTLTFDLVTSKCIGVIYWVQPIFLLSTMTVTQKLFKILIGNGFCIKATVTLTFDLLTPKCIVVINWP